jgi:putative ABC transport system permease protein
VVKANNTTFPLVPLPPTAAQTLATIPGVATVYPYNFTFISWHGRRVLLFGGPNDPKSHFDVVAGEPLDSMDKTGGLVVSTQIATIDGVQVGDSVTLPTPSGDHTYRVATIEKSLSWTEGAMFLGEQAFTRDFQTTDVHEYWVELLPAATFSRVSSEVRSRLGAETVVQTGPEFAAMVNDINEAIQAPFVQMRNVGVLVAILAVFNTLLIAVLQRRREIGVLRAIGMQISQLRTSLILEASLMVLVALGAAAVLGTILQVLGLTFIAASTGLPIHWSWQPLGLLFGAASAIVIVAAGSLYPARQAGRVPVLEAIAYE